MQYRVVLVDQGGMVVRRLPSIFSYPEHAEEAALATDAPDHLVVAVEIVWS